MPQIQLPFGVSLVPVVVCLKLMASLALGRGEQLLLLLLLPPPLPSGPPVTSPEPEWLEASGQGELLGLQRGGPPAGGEASPPWPEEGLCPSAGGWLLKTSLVCALGLLVVAGNAAVMAVIASSVAGWSRSSRLALLSLAAADAAVALLVVPLNLYGSLALGLGGPAGEASAPSYCRPVAFVNSSLFGASLYSLAAVSLERYVAVFFPLRSGRLLGRRRRLALLLAAAWLLPAVLLAPLAVPGPRAVLRVRFSAAALLCEPDYASNAAYSLLLAASLFGPAAGAVTFANLGLWLAARSQRRKGRPPAAAKESLRLRLRLRLRPRPLAAASRLLLPVVAAFYGCWAPCIATILYNAITGERVHEWVEFVALWLPTGSGFLNCFVYFWTNRRFRHKFRKIGHQLCRPCYRARAPQHHLPPIAAAVERDSERTGFPRENSHSLSSNSHLMLSQESQTGL